MKMDAQIIYIDEGVAKGKPFLNLSVNILVPIDKMREIRSQLEAEDNIRIEIFKLTEVAL